MRAAAILAAALAIGACGDGGDPAPAASAATPVAIWLVAYEPATVEIPAGGSVTWEQLDPGAHTVTSGTVEQLTAGAAGHPDGRFDSGELATGTTFEHTFAEPGTYPYFCELHPSTMRGEISVT